MTTEAAPTQTRKVSILLGIGIFFAPIVFAWFTLRKGHSKLAKIVSLGWLALSVLVYVSSLGSPDTQSTARQDKAALAARTPEQVAADEAALAVENFSRHPETALELIDVDGSKEGFETVLEIRGKITNAAPFDIKDPEIECVLAGPSGTQVGTVRQTLFEIIPANGTKNFSGLNMGFMGSSQVAAFGCSIKRAVRP